MASLVAALAQARGRDQATQLELELEALREQAVQPTVRLLLRRAQREMASADHHAAVGDLTDAAELQPDNPLILRQRAAARAATGDLDGAVGDLGMALSHDPDDVLTWQILAGVEEQRASWAAAFKAWQHVMELDPQLPGGSKRLDRLHRKAFGQPA